MDNKYDTKAGRYKLIVSEYELAEFLKSLPNEENHIYYYSLLARKKYSPTEEIKKYFGKKSEIKLFDGATKRKYLINEIRELEKPIGSYKFKENNVEYGNIDIPVECMVLYITINPRCMIKSSWELKAELDKGLRNNKISQPPHKMALSVIQNTCANMNFMDWDFDLDKSVFSSKVLKEILLQKVGLVEEDYMMVETRGGYHVLVKTERGKQLPKNWFNNMNNTYNEYSNDSGNVLDKLVPLPYTYQGGFEVILK